jgi:hypothetical protein
MPRETGVACMGAVKLSKRAVISDDTALTLVPSISTNQSKTPLLGMRGKSVIL